MSIGSEVKARSFRALVVREKVFILHEKMLISDLIGKGQPEMDFVVAGIQHVVLSSSVVARQYDFNANQVLFWRRLHRDVPPAAAVASTSRLIPMMVAANRMLSSQWSWRSDQDHLA
jgi:hypothetical protein